jgi:uncharacterized protein with FMN-binding domain
MTQLRHKVLALLGAAIFAAPAADAAIAVRHPKKHPKPAKKAPAKKPKPKAKPKPVVPPEPKPAPVVPTVVVESKDVTGTVEGAGDWGLVQVVVTIQKTTTTTGTNSTVDRKITDVKVPVFPSDAARSAFISSHTIPQLVRETLTEQSADIHLVGGATYTSRAFVSSLQAALLLAQKI